MATEEAQGALEEGDGRQSFLVRQDLDVGQAGGVVDRHVSVLPSRSPIPFRSIAGRSMARSLAPSTERLDIEVHEFAHDLALVAPRRLLRLQQLELPDALAPQDPRDGRPRHTQAPGDLPGRLPAASQNQDPLDPPSRRTIANRTRAA